MTGVVRPAEPRDIARLEEIENDADALLIGFLRPDHWDPAPTGDSRLRSPGFVLIVSESADGEAVGFVHVIESDGFAHLEQLSMLPDHAGRGLGRTLVVAAMDEASRLGYDHMTLRTYAEVPWNAPFYATCGFVETEPATAFQRRLLESERLLGLAQYGRRIQMSVKTATSRR